MINRILDNIYGSILVSVIIGFGLASLFRFTCKYKNCIQYIAPKRNTLENKTVQWKKKCYKPSVHFVPCKDNDEVIQEPSV